MTTKSRRRSSNGLYSYGLPITPSIKILDEWPPQHRDIMIITLTYYIIIFMLSHISPIIHNPNVQLATAITGHGRYGIGTGSGWNALAIAVGSGIHYGGHRWPGARCHLRWQQGAHNQLPG